jgi:L-asparaginase II
VTSPVVVEVGRGAWVESRHVVHLAVHQAGRGLIAGAGDCGYVSFVRSAIKMFQALPLVEDGGIARFGLTAEELALCTASHSGEAYHVEAARSILRKAQARESALACGPHEPMHAPSAQQLAAAGRAPDRIHNNCSGKHAGMLALAALHGWPLEGYERVDHPVQQRVMQTLAHWADVPRSTMQIAVDGCGLPTFALPLDRVASACARLGAAAADGVAAPTAIIGAMTAAPEYVAGTGRLCTLLMRATGGRVVAKVGAEGYYCAIVPDARIGMALKVEDGARRASEPALLAVLRACALITEDQLQSLEAFARPVIDNTLGERVGEIRAVVPPLR